MQKITIDNQTKYEYQITGETATIKRISDGENLL